MNKIPCEIIRDLFPSYIDQLTSDKTNLAVEEHIKECKSNVGFSYCSCSGGYCKYVFRNIN